ncbi:methionine aminotransferase [Arenibacter sp. 6A1]|uniref:methionine aminotransferase n=1 Tax=Arenibacter sp. 6A1 TaxID=2720391 RepID=UPI00144555BA|nr:methionine aminotransferase [Arenibacter sp. 6A1]NKI26785.1 methionine aminotransferase [Arenibacter sp. 6A1]
MPTFRSAIVSKLPLVKTTIFTTMGQLAQKHQAINLSQGFPNFEPDPELIALVTEAMNQGFNQYAPMAGLWSLREIIAEKIEALHGQSYDPETEITVTVGATQAIFTIITAFISPMDEVILFKPAYDCYEPAIRLNGGIPVGVQLKKDDFTVDWDEFRAKITPKTKMVVINTPHNPSGTILSKADMIQLQDSLKDTGIIVISDEVYEHIIFDGHEHQSASRFHDLAQRTFVCSSFGKTFHITGWKLGYCVAPAELMKEFRKTHQFNVFSVDHAAQKAMADYLKTPQHYLDLPKFYEQKRNLFVAGLNGSRFTIKPCSGSYFQLLDYSAISEENDMEFAERLVVEHKIASIPLSGFNTEDKTQKLVRFCFAKTTETLEKATAVLRTI